MRVLHNNNSILRFLAITGWSWALWFLFSDVTNGQIYENYCGSEPCVEDIPIPCEEMIETYEFQGSCCSMENIPEIGGCRITVPIGDCYWYRRCGKCETEKDAVGKCNTLFETDARQDCPAGGLDPLEIQESEDYAIPSCDPTISPTDDPDPKELIAGYLPRSRVTDQNAIDLDQEMMEEQLARANEDAYSSAFQVYTNGAHSGMVAEVTLGVPLDIEIVKGTPVVGVATDGTQVTGTVYDKVFPGADRMSVQYDTFDSQKNYINCQVGGSTRPNTEGCFAETGTMVIDGSTEVLYTYNILADNIAKRTIQDFSTSAKWEMYDCANCPYDMYQAFFGYYGVFDYADQIVLAAFRREQTNFKNFNNDFGLYGYLGREQIIKKGTVFLGVWMYVIRQMEDALDECMQDCENCNDYSVDAWDQAVAFYTGSLEGTDGSGPGKLLYAEADKRCSNFKTCGESGDASSGTSQVNIYIFGHFNNGQAKLPKGECDSARKDKEAIERLMLIPLIQGTLRFAWKTDNLAYSEKAEAEGVIFYAGIAPMIHKCNPESAQIIADNMVAGQSGTASFLAVKAAFESTYKCLGIDGAIVGGLYDAPTEMYFPGAEPLTNAPTPAPTGCDYNNDSDIVARLNEIFGEENCIEMNDDTSFSNVTGDDTPFSELECSIIIPGWFESSIVYKSRESLNGEREPFRLELYDILSPSWCTAFEDLEYAETVFPDDSCGGSSFVISMSLGGPNDCTDDQVLGKVLASIEKRRENLDFPPISLMNLWIPVTTYEDGTDCTGPPLTTGAITSLTTMDGEGIFCEGNEVSNTTLYFKIVIPFCDAQSWDTVISHRFTCIDPACTDCSEDGTTQTIQIPSASQMNDENDFCLASEDDTTKIITLTRFTRVGVDGMYWKILRGRSCLLVPPQTELDVLAVVPDEFDLYEVADIAERIVEIALAEAEETIDVRRELQGGKEGLPDSCIETKEGTSDSQCKNINKGNVSYQCKRGEGYVCCNEDQGGKFATGSIAGKCFRNDDNGERTTTFPPTPTLSPSLTFSPTFLPTDTFTSTEADTFTPTEAKYDFIRVESRYIKGDPNIGVYTALPVLADCGTFPESFRAEAGDKCIKVTMTLYGTNVEELEVYTLEINDAVESGIVETVLMNEYGVPDAKFKVDPDQTFPTPSPTIVPTTKNKTIVEEIMDDVNNEIPNIFKDRTNGTTTEGASGNTTRSKSSFSVFMTSMAVTAALFIFS